MITTNRFLTVVLLIAIATASVSMFALKTHGNPSAFFTCPTSQTGTTTTSFLNAGTGTTTLQLPNPNCGPNNLTASDSAFLQFQVTASTSPSVQMNIRIEHSRDGNDWYPESVATNINATSTNMTGDSAVYHFAMATSTDNGGNGTPTRLHRSMVVTTPTAYTRVIFYVPTGGGAASLYAELDAKKQSAI